MTHRRAWTTARARAATLALAGLAAGLLGGCTADEAGPLGSGLPLGPGFDTLLVPVSLDTLDGFARAVVTDPDVPFDSSQVLYLGRQGSERSAILARYDFRSFSGPPWDGVEFSLENVRSVQVRLFMLEKYIALQPAGGKRGLIKRYWVHPLADTLASGAYPAPEPALGPRICSEERAAGASVELPLPRQLFLDWVAAGTHTGLMVSEGDSAGSQAGLIGFASRELRVFEELDLEDDDTIVGPILRIEFFDPDTTVVLAPVADVSTLSPLDEPPADPDDGFVLQTHRRDYPALGFALDALPAGAVVNRAVLTVTSDSLASYGPLLDVVCGEADSSLFPAARNELTLDELAAGVKGLATIAYVDPTSARRLRFDVTAAVQRWANGAYAQPRRWVLLAAEDFLSSIDETTTDPDFFLARLRLRGAGAPDPADRPQLLIHYTPRAGAGEGAR